MPNNNTASRNPSLKHNKSVYESRLIFGVPSNIFVMASLFVIAVFILAGFIASLIIFFIFIPPLIIVYQDDDKGLLFLLDKALRPDFYSAGAVTDIGVKVVKIKGDQHILEFIEHQ